MAESPADVRIRDLKRRLDLDPGSRLFLALAEEYRKSGRLTEALSTLQRGLLAHPNYLSAQVALGRAYFESGQATEAIATFSRVLAADPGNLVSAKSLADIHLARGDSLEAVKKYKLYRALSGDRSVDEVIARLDRELAPAPPAPPAPVESAPPPPAFAADSAPRTAAATSPGALEVPDMPIQPTPAGAEPDPSEAATQAMRISEILPRAALAPPPEAPESDREPQGRTLADLYFAQGHYAEALRIYDELVAANPFDEELRRLRRDAEARLLPASTSATSSADSAFERRLKKIRALRQWLSVLQAG
jgi:tetratricopeptide (TPR) repeat protein